MQVHLLLCRISVLASITTRQLQQEQLPLCVNKILNGIAFYT
jgi:hypothetical protein